MRARLTRAFDYFVDVRALNDVELAKRIARDEVHILVDLNGYTKRNRAQVLEFRPSPVCVHYLAYPGTLGSPCVDYFIADSFVIPPGDERFFREAIVRLPGCYQANDDKREVPDLGKTRRDAGLPDKAFVFCCFNRPYKITPEVFDVWMRILGSTPGSVLWLLADSERVESNLRREATRRGVDAQRIVFAPRVSNSEHLARQRHADLFLDTWPVCAHTTASDALWVGLPLLTCPGRTFISRVAGSLLTAIGLPELVAPSSATYEALAIDLARDPGALMALRERLAINRGARSPFKTKRSCRNLEAAFEKMWEILQRGEAPHGFALEEGPG
jgi:predicted O-linked N-acetylglucosamine transferase (SPINDLY family)